jgi:excisionase family DNA binding protein
VSIAAVLSDSALKRYVAPSEAARRLGVSGSRVRQLIEAGRLSALVTPLGKIVPVADVEAERVRRLGLASQARGERGGTGALAHHRHPLPEQEGGEGSQHQQGEGPGGPARSAHAPASLQSVGRGAADAVAPGVGSVAFFGAADRETCHRLG